jgi:hypothetical protein
VKFTRFRIEGKDWFDRAGQQAIFCQVNPFLVRSATSMGCSSISARRVSHLQRYLESGLQNLAQLRGIGSGHPDAPLALGVEALAYLSRARIIAIALG